MHIYSCWSYDCWCILSILILGILYIWGIPYMQMAQVAFYESIKPQNVELETVGPEVI